MVEYPALKASSASEYLTLVELELVAQPNREALLFARQEVDILPIEVLPLPICCVLPDPAFITVVGVVFVMVTLCLDEVPL